MAVPGCSKWLNSQEVAQNVLGPLKAFSGENEATGMRILKKYVKSTSFLNTVIACLLYSSELREYFLNTEHLHNGSSACIVGNVASIFREFYWNATKPICGDTLLYVVWTKVGNPSWIQKQDPFDFMLLLLKFVHEPPCMLIEDETDTSNIIQTTFEVALQSDIVCLTCVTVTTTFKFIRCCSLDVGPVLLEKTSVTLHDCLKYFTEVKSKGCNEGCSVCNDEVMSHLTITKVPSVFSIQLNGSQQSKKISFPSLLDVTPFLSSKVTHLRAASDNLYSLYAVISPTDRGLYTAYVQVQPDYWYRMDDYIVTNTTIEHVLQSEAYMLFYQKVIC